MHYFLIEQYTQDRAMAIRYAADQFGLKPYKIISLYSEKPQKVKAKEVREKWKELSPGNDCAIIACGLTPIRLMQDDFDAKINKYRRVYTKNIHCVADPENRKDFIRDLNSGTMITRNNGLPLGSKWAIDIETNKLLPWHEDSKILSISISTNDSSYSIVSLEELAELYKMQQPELIIGHNLKFDLNWLKMFGVDLFGANLYDTMIAEYLLDENSSKGLEDLIFKYTNIDNYWSKINIKKVNEIPIKELSVYNGHDTAATFGVYKRQKVLLLSKNVKPGLLNLEIDKLRSLAQVEYNGMYVNKDLLINKMREAEEHVTSYKESIRGCAPSINPNSGKQVGRYLYEHLKLPAVYTDKGQYRTDNQTLQRLQEESNSPFLHGLVKLRTYNKLLNTYYANIRKLTDYRGLLHGNFNQAQVVTGRLSSSGGVNFQNIPARDSAQVESLFSSRYPGGKVIKVDFSQMELRLLADISRDDTMLDAFNKGEDFHEATATRLGVSRTEAKTINFKIVYGGGTKEQEDAWFKAYPQAKKWRERTVFHYRKRGWVESPFGRTRRLGRSTNSFKEKLHKERQSHNSIIQGMASDVTMVALIHLIKEGYECINTVHDSIIIDVPGHECTKEYINSIKLICEKLIVEDIYKQFGYVIKCPLRVDIAEGEDWGECK